MVQKTLKRKTEDRNSDSDNNDATWGGKRCRYRYNYILELPSSNSSHSDDTDSVYSIQSKSTALVVSEEDSLSDSEYNRRFVDPSNGEFDLVDTPSSDSSTDNLSSSDTTDIEFEIINPIKCDKMTDSTDNDYTDTLKTADDTQKTNVPPPACFQLCLQCMKLNQNPYYQYCFSCFAYRMSISEDKPKAKPKGAKQRLNMSRREKEYNALKASESTPNSEQTVSGLNSFPDINNDYDICHICFLNPKNGIFNHKKIAHNYCCYLCAKRLKKISNKCPMCNLKFKFITKLINV